MRKDSVAAWGRFVARVEELGGRVLEDGWKGSRTPHRAVCREGHDCRPRPNNVDNGQGICRVCVGQDAELAWKAFHERVEARGGRVLEDSWKGSGKPHQVECREGHRNRVTPNHVQQGDGICRDCAGYTWDVFYVVSGPEGLKFGITSGDARGRLRVHRRAGYTAVRFVAEGLPDGVARKLELDLIHQLRDAGVAPVRGREYYPVTELGRVLGTAAKYLSA